jgi:hypothetical protein
MCAVPLDALTVEVLRTPRLRQADERQGWGAGYEANDLVFAREDGSMTRPEGVSRRFREATTRATSSPSTPAATTNHFTGNQALAQQDPEMQRCPAKPVNGVAGHRIW